MLKPHYLYAEQVSPENMEQVFQLSRAVKDLPTQVMEVSDTFERMLSVNPKAQRKMEKAVEAAQEAAKALAVLDVYLEAMKTELV